MRVGISLRSMYRAADGRAGAAWMVERTAAAREAGLDSLFVGDAHVTAPTAQYQNTPILGRVLAEWGSAPAGALYVLPLWHPVLVAEQVAVLACIAKGRFILQCAIGDGAQQFAGMGVELGERRHRFEAGLDVIRRLLRGAQVTTGEPYRINAARIAPLPPEPVEVWVAGHADAAVDRAARLGDGWLAGPAATDAEAATLVARYQERCAAHGRTPTAVAIRRDVHVGADHAEAWAVAGPVLAGGYRGFDTAACVVGGPAEVAARFTSYAAMGYTDVVVRHLADDHGDVLASIHRLGEVRDLVTAP